MTQQYTAEPGDRFVVRVDSAIADLVPDFLERRREDIQSLLEALGQCDYEAIRALGHIMKGIGGGYGFDAITHIGDCLELAANEQSDEEVRTLVSQLAAYVERVEVVYE